MSRLAGKSVVITGAGSGIGRATAQLFAQNGAALVIADKSAAVNDVAEAIRQGGGQALAMTGDAGDEAFVEDLVGRAAETHGRIDAFFANAGITGGPVPFFELTPDVWSNVLRTNLIGPFLAIKHAGRRMIEQGKGSIICTASVAGIRSGAGPVPYSASKAGVINLVQTVANEFYGSGVRVNAICPGLIETGMTQPLFDNARARGTENRIGQLNPLTRAGAPIEIAQAALFLASDDASYVNGQAIVVDGGLSSSHPVGIRNAKERPARFN